MLFNRHETKLNIPQRIARYIGKLAGPNSWFIHPGQKNATWGNPDNRNVYTSIKPMQISRPLATIGWRHLFQVIKARFQR